MPSIAVTPLARLAPSLAKACSRSLSESHARLVSLIEVLGLVDDRSCSVSHLVITELQKKTGMFLLYLSEVGFLPRFQNHPPGPNRSRPPKTSRDRFGLQGIHFQIVSPTAVQYFYFSALLWYKNLTSAITRLTVGRFSKSKNIPR